MGRRQAIRVGALVWAAVGAVISLGSLGATNADAFMLVAAASVLGPLAAVGAAWLLAHGSDRAAGALLLVSVLTPTYFAYPLNLPALVVGIALVVAPRAVLPRETIALVEPQASRR